MDWQNAQRIAELPEVDEALANFCDDSTLDNAVGLVLAVLGAAPRASEAVRTCACHPDDRPAGECQKKYAAQECQTQADKDGGDCAKGAGDVAMRDAAFEAVRKRLCAIPRYSFYLDDDGVVRRVEGRSGNWIEFDAAHELFDPVAVDAALAAQKHPRTDGGGHA